MLSRRILLGIALCLLCLSLLACLSRSVGDANNTTYPATSPHASGVRGDDACAEPSSSAQRRALVTSAASYAAAATSGEQSANEMLDRAAVCAQVSGDGEQQDGENTSSSEDTSASTLRSLPPPSLSDLIYDMLMTNHGSRVAAAMYDEGYYDAVLEDLQRQAANSSAASRRGGSTSTGDGKPAAAAANSDTMFQWKSHHGSRVLLPEIELLEWTMDKRRMPAGVPKSFFNTENMLLRIKQHFSLALGRIAHDKQLQEMYAHLLVQSHSSSNGETQQTAAAASTDNQELLLFKIAVGKVINSQVQYFSTVVQLMADVSYPRSSTTATDAAPTESKSGEERRSGDVAKAKHPLVALAKLQLVNKRNRDTQKATSWRVANYGNGRTEKKMKTRAQLHAIPPLTLNTPVYNQQQPRNGKFWNMLRPSLQCTTLLRLCEMPDGCRFVCNLEYMKLRSSGGTWSGQRLKAKGRGNGEVGSESRSNGDYLHFVGFGSNNEYEWEESLLNTFGPQIGSISTFDCTLGGSGNRKWRVPDALQQHSVGMGHSDKCIDKKPTSSSITMPQVRPLLRDGVDVTRYAISSKLTTASEPFALMRDVNTIAILKLDIEGYEFVVIPQWLRSELVAAAMAPRAEKGTKSSKKRCRNTIDYESDLKSDFFAIETLQMEFHRMGHKANHGANVPSSLQAHLLLLHMHSLGYMMVGQERNHIDNCCYELSFVHYSYFVRSEIWMGLNMGR